MAIIIPSKNIYEISNPKVRDNVIDNVSVEQTVVKKKNEANTTVYTNTLETTNLEYTELKTGYDQDYDSTYDRYETVYLEGKGIYFQYENFKIPVLQNNKYIQRLILGKNEQGEANIYVSVLGRKVKGIVSQQFNYNEGFKSERTFTETERIDDGFAPKITNEISYSLRYSSASISFSNDQITSVKYHTEVIDGVEYYILSNMKILVGINWLKMRGVTKDENLDLDFTLEGEYEEFIPTTVELSFKGNTIGIDLTKTTETYGQGKFPYSLKGSELTQTTLTKGNPVTIKIKNVDAINNITYRHYFETTKGEIDVSKPFVVEDLTLSVYEYEDYYYFESWKILGRENETIVAFYVDGLAIDNIASNILSQYKYGKETATLLCDINDYYDENGLISKIANRKFPSFEYSLIKKYKESVKLNVKLSYPVAYQTMCRFNVGGYDFKGSSLIDFEEEKGYRVFEVCFESGETENTIDLTFGKVEEVSKYDVLENASMVFKNHDKVIPYVFGANGKDQPMSKYNDGSPKVFEVVGTNILYDGAVWQELSLQEVLQKNNL